MSKRRRFKTRPLLTRAQAYAHLRCEHFRQDLYHRVKENILMEFSVRCYRQPKLEYRIMMTMRSTFDEAYLSSTDELVSAYFQRYANPDKPLLHFDDSFFSLCRGKLFDQLEYVFTDGRPTDGFGCIYYHKPD